MNLVPRFIIKREGKEITMQSHCIEILLFRRDGFARTGVSRHAQRRKYLGMG
jgi:hypothetical protein